MQCSVVTVSSVPAVSRQSQSGDVQSVCPAAAEARSAVMTTKHHTASLLWNSKVNSDGHITVCFVLVSHTNF